MSQRGDSAACVRGRGEDDAADDDHAPGSPGDFVLSGADWYALEGCRRRAAHGDNGGLPASAADALASKQRAAMTMVMLLDALASKKADDRPVIINPVSTHSRLVEAAGKTAGRGNLPQGVADGANGTNGTNGTNSCAHEDAQQAGKGSDLDARVPESNGHSTHVNGHASHLANGAANGSALDGAQGARGANGNEDAEELERLFEKALVVHRGKPGTHI